MVTISGGISSVVDGLRSSAAVIRGNPVASVIGGTVAGGAIVGAVVASRRKSKKSTRKAPKKRSRTARTKRRKTTPKYARTAGKRKDTSTRRIRMTKNGQPYIILRSGKARFIKKSSARTSRRRKGGRY